MKIVWSVIAGIILVFGFGNLAIKYDSRLAKAEELRQSIVTLEKLNQRIDAHIVDERRIAFQRRIYEIENQYRGQHMPKSVLDELTFLKIELAKLQNER